MQKNKFNIGQKVIVIDGGHVMEKVVVGIFPDSSSGELRYELEGKKKKTNHFIDWYYPSEIWTKEAAAQALEIMPPPIWMEQHRPNKNVVCKIRPAGARPNVMVLDDIDGKFLESEIFENEADFRANVKISFIEPTEAELIEELKSVPSSAFTTGSEHVRELIQKIHSK